MGEEGGGKRRGGASLLSRAQSGEGVVKGRGGEGAKGIVNRVI